MINENEFVQLPVSSNCNQETTPLESPLLRVKKGSIEIEIYSGIERYMFFHLLKELILDDC